VLIAIIDNIKMYIECSRTISVLHDPLNVLIGC